MGRDDSKGGKQHEERRTSTTPMLKLPRAACPFIELTELEPRYVNGSDPSIHLSAEGLKGLMRKPPASSLQEQYNLSRNEGALDYYSNTSMHKITVYLREGPQAALAPLPSLDGGNLE